MVKVTGTEPGSVGIGSRGRLALRRVAIRSGVPTTATWSSRKRWRHETCCGCRRRNNRLGEHFALGLKDLLPMAYSKCAASVDKGLAKSDLQGAWSVPRVPLTGSRPEYWPTAWDCRTCP